MYTPKQKKKERKKERTLISALYSTQTNSKCILDIKSKVITLLEDNIWKKNLCDLGLDKNHFDVMIKAQSVRKKQIEKVSEIFVRKIIWKLKLRQKSNPIHYLINYGHDSRMMKKLAKIN